MAAAGSLDSAPAGQAVGDHARAFGDAGPGELFDLVLPEALDHGQPEMPPPALGGGLDSGDERRLAGSAAATLAARPLAAEISKDSQQQITQESKAAYAG